jgi:hypothetical protein
VLGAGVAVVAASPAQAATICDQYGSTTSGNYVIMNNRWGTSATQCISTSSNGFTITTQNGSASTSGAPTAYPAIYYGCHYGNCSPGTALPKQVSSISSAPSSINYTYASGTYDAAYDIWLDPTAKTTGVNATEIMIWFNHTGSIQPVGSNTGQTVNIGGRSFVVWQGNNGGNDVVSYVATSTMNSWSFDVKSFVNDTISRGKANNSWYLTSIQAGFEPWNGGVGLAVSGFSASINGGGGGGGGGSTTTTTRTTTRTTTTSTSSGGGGGGGTKSCSASLSIQSNWNGGYVAQVHVSGSGISGWDVTLNLGGSSITNGWNATISGNHATNANYNGGGGDFGFQANGSSSGVSVASCSAH